MKMSNQERRGLRLVLAHAHDTAAAQRTPKDHDAALAAAAWIQQQIASPAVLGGDTITDEQIREWEAEEIEICGPKNPRGGRKWRAIDLATMALSDEIAWDRVRSGEIDPAVANEHNRKRREARAHVAEILNARAGKAP